MVGIDLFEETACLLSCLFVFVCLRVLADSFGILCNSLNYGNDVHTDRN